VIEFKEGSRKESFNRIYMEKHNTSNISKFYKEGKI